MKEVTFGEALELANLDLDSTLYLVLVFDNRVGKTAFVAGGPIPSLLSGIDAMRSEVLRKQSEGLN